MAGRGSTAAAGGPARHIPVMLSEVLDALQPKDGDVVVDGTFGAGGYTQAILDAADCKVIAIDRDAEAKMPMLSFDASVDDQTKTDAKVAQLNAVGIRVR